VYKETAVMQEKENQCNIQDWNGEGGTRKCMLRKTNNGENLKDKINYIQKLQKMRFMFSKTASI
jgi:hypothetical protein